MKAEAGIKPARWFMTGEIRARLVQIVSSQPGNEDCLPPTHALDSGGLQKTTPGTSLVRPEVGPEEARRVASRDHSTDLGRSRHYSGL